MYLEKQSWVKIKVEVKINFKNENQKHNNLFSYRIERGFYIKMN